MATEIKTLTKGLIKTPEEKPGWEAYELSCLMRIADATEVMAKNHVQLMRDRDNYERWYREQLEKVRKLEASNASLRGVITRMKNEKKRKEKEATAEKPDAT